MISDATPTSLTATARTSLSAQVRMQLREMIFGGSLAPGDRLDESHLSRTLDVSRASIREALHQLVGEGLLVHQPNKGMFVRVYDARATRDLFTARLSIEPVTARLAARWATDSDIATLDQLLRDLGLAARDGNWNATMLADARLHLAIARASGNDALARVVETLRGETQLLVTKSGPSIYESPTDVLLEHQELVRAVQAADQELAERLTRQHIDTAATRFLGQDWAAHRKVMGWD